MKKTLKNSLISVFILIALLLANSFIYLILSNSNNVYANVEGQSVSTVKNDNKQVYLADDGKNHTIYWAQGIDAPLMDNKDGKVNTPGYFERFYTHNVNQSGYVTEILSYESYFMPDHGYYDLNKNLSRFNKEKSYCYLCSASNLIYWWLEQNSSYINEYVNQIQKNNFIATDGLVNIEDINIWNNLLQKPPMVQTEGLLTQEMTKSSLATAFQETFIKRDSGYWMDRVIDHFINGYTAITDDSQNSENNYTKQIYGGYFYPIFYNQRLSYRYTRVDYDFYNENLVKFIQDGKGLSLSYYNRGSDSSKVEPGSHAITVWGVEYDANNNLSRIYVTDSDDYNQTTTRNTDKIRGLHSFEVKKDPSNGQMYFTTNINENASVGSKLQAFVTFDLAQDVWQAKLNDLEPPKKPNIISQPQDQTYSNNEIYFDNLKVEIKQEDQGVLSYQWYKSDSNNGVGVKMEGQNKSWLKPDKPTNKPVYYFCEIVNNKNGKVSEVVKTRYAKVVTNDNVTNAAPPTVSYVLNNGSTKYDYKQYEQPKPLKINASSPDGGKLSYQWYEKINSLDYNPNGGTLLKGETRNIFYPKTNVYNDASQNVYYCIVTNRKEDVNGKKETSLAPKVSLRVTITEARTFTNALAPAILENPKSATFNNISDVTPLSVLAKSLDDGVLSYKWYVNGSLVNGVNSPNYKPTNLVKGTNYVYCEITNTNTNATVSTTNTSTSNTAEIVLNNETTLPSTNNNLASLSVLNYDITPTFTPEQITYTLQVEYAVSSITINATKADEKASLTGTGVKELNVGLNTFNIIVTAENGAQKTYTTNVTRKEKPYVPSTNNNLSTLEVVGQQISPKFSAEQTTYTLEVEYAVSSITINATKADEKASLTGTGVKELNVGLNTFNIVVTAENNAQKTYTINVTRKEKPYVPSTNNNLASLSVLNYDITPNFTPEQITYTLQVEYEVSSIIINATKADEKASLTGTGVKELSVGLNTFNIVVTAENKEQKTYTINVTRKEKPYVPSTNNNLSTLEVVGQTITPNFTPEQITYTLQVEYEVSSITINATKADEKASLTGTGVKELQEGLNTFKIVVTAENEVSKTYTINVTRKAPKTDNSLSSIIINGSNALPNFDKDVLNYEINVPYNCNSLQIEGILDPQNGAKIEVVGNTNFKVGENKVLLKVTAQNGEERTYTIIVNRQQEINDKDIKTNNTIKILIIVFSSIAVVSVVGVITFKLILKNKKKNIKK